MLSSMLYPLICIIIPIITSGLDEQSEAPHKQRGTWMVGQITVGDADVTRGSNPRWEWIKDQDSLPHVGRSLSSTLVLIPR